MKVASRKKPKNFSWSIKEKFRFSTVSSPQALKSNSGSQNTSCTNCGGRSVNNDQ